MPRDDDLGFLPLVLRAFRVPALRWTPTRPRSLSAGDAGRGADLTVVSVVFDVGETLLDDSREFGAWAARLGAPRPTFSPVRCAGAAAGRENPATLGYPPP